MTILRAGCASALLLLAGFTAIATAAAPGGLGGQLTGTDAYKKTMGTPTTGTKFKKKLLSHGKDQVAPVLFLAEGAAPDSGTFTIESYESFPVTGTWTLAAHNRVTLAVDAAAFAAQKGPELCPGDVCVPTATWTPKVATFNPKTSLLKARWLVTVKMTNPDGSYVLETFAFKGAGKLLPTT